MADVVGAFGRCDILVNNAAWNIGIPFRQLQTLDADTWDRVLETNLRGPFLLCRALAEHLRAGDGGRIVNIASVGGLNPGSSSIAYSCSKAGLIHLTHCLAVALAPEISVNCVAPGLVEGTRMALRLPDEVSAGARRQAVLGKVGSAEDIADATVMLCRADTITGQTIVVDGGHARRDELRIARRRRDSVDPAVPAVEHELAALGDERADRCRVVLQQAAVRPAPARAGGR